MTTQHREWAERCYSVLSAGSPCLSMDEIQNPDPDADSDAAMLFVLMALLTPPEVQTAEVQRRAIRLAERMADNILAEHRAELQNYVYGSRPSGFAQLFWFICNLAGVELTLRRSLKEDDAITCTN